MERYRLSDIAAASMLTTGIAMMSHELAHVAAGRLAGGTPTLLTTTELLGDFDSLSAAGFVALGISGSAINVLLCVLGWFGLRKGSASAGPRLTAWLFFTLNGMLVTTKMVGEAAAGFGDWMTVLRPWPAMTLARILIVGAGTAGVAFMVRRSGALLADIVAPGVPVARRGEAARIVIAGAVASTILVLGGAVASPAGTLRSTLLALGAGLGPFLPMMLGVRFVGRLPSRIEGPLDAGRSWLLLVGTAVVVLFMWFVIGPGLDLSRGTV